MIHLMEQRRRTITSPRCVFNLVSMTAAWLTLIATTMLTPIASAESVADPSIVAIIKAIEQGWEKADGTPFRQHFLDIEGTRYIEGGGQNKGLVDLIEHHVEPEGDALEGFDLTLSNIETHVEGEFAWAIADVELVATIKKDNKRLHLRGYETFLFRSVDGAWKVVHTHSSSRPIDTKQKERKH